MNIQHKIHFENDNGIDVVLQLDLPKVSTRQLMVLQQLCQEDSYIGISEGLDGIKCTLVCEGDSETINNRTFKALLNMGAISGIRMAMVGCTDYYQYEINSRGKEIVQAKKLA